MSAAIDSRHQQVLREFDADTRQQCEVLRATLGDDSDILATVLIEYQTQRQQLVRTLNDIRARKLREQQRGDAVPGYTPATRPATVTFTSARARDGDGSVVEQYDAYRSPRCIRKTAPAFRPASPSPRPVIQNLSVPHSTTATTETDTGTSSSTPSSSETKRDTWTDAVSDTSHSQLTSLVESEAATHSSRRSAIDAVQASVGSLTLDTKADEESQAVTVSVTQFATSPFRNELTAMMSPFRPAVRPSNPIPPMSPAAAPQSPPAGLPNAQLPYRISSRLPSQRTRKSFSVDPSPQSSPIRAHSNNPVPYGRSALIPPMQISEIDELDTESKCEKENARQNRLSTAHRAIVKQSQESQSGAKSSVSSHLSRSSKQSHSSYLPLTQLANSQFNSHHSRSQRSQSSTYSSSRAADLSASKKRAREREAQAKRKQALNELNRAKSRATKCKSVVGLSSAVAQTAVINARARAELLERERIQAAMINEHERRRRVELRRAALIDRTALIAERLIDLNKPRDDERRHVALKEFASGLGHRTLHGDDDSQYQSKSHVQSRSSSTAPWSPNKRRIFDRELLELFESIDSSTAHSPGARKPY